MFQWIESLSAWGTLGVILAVVIINVLYAIIVKAHLESYYAKTNSVELALNRLRILSQYVSIVFISLSSFVITVLFMSKLRPFFDHSAIHVLIGLLCAFTFIGGIITFTQIYLFRTTQKIRGTEQTMKEEISGTIKGLAITFIPIIILIMILNIVPEGFLWGKGGIVVSILFIILLPFMITYLIGKMLKAYEMPDSTMKEQLVQFLARTGVNEVELLIWPTKKNKVANAFVTGFTRKKRIYISDYLLENMTMVEIESILAHEIGHIKKHHLWKRLGQIIILPILGYALGYGMERFEETYAEIPVWLGMAIISGLLILYLGILINFISRTQEREADEYVLQLGVDYRDFAQALLKLAKLNYMLTKMNKVDESFQTHPSIARRIHWIIQLANGSLEELEEYNKTANSET